MLREDLRVYEMLPEGNLWGNLPNSLSPLVTAQVLGGYLDRDLLLHQAQEMRGMTQTWPSYPTAYLSFVDLSKPLLILFMLSASTTSQTNKFQMCTKYYFILFDLQLLPSISH